MADLDGIQPAENKEEAFLTVSRPAARFLLETSKWAYFLAIMGLILSGLIVVLALFAGKILSMMSRLSPDQSSNLPPGFAILISVIYAAMGAIYFVPSWYLLKYSQKLKSALSSRDSNELTTALENEKSLYKFWGIFAIVMIALYAVLIAIIFLVSMIAGPKMQSALL